MGHKPAWHKYFLSSKLKTGSFLYWHESVPK